MERTEEEEKKGSCRKIVHLLQSLPLSAVLPPKAPYDFQERSTLFAERVRALGKKVPRTLSNEQDLKQLIRSSGSIGANYIEAGEALSKKDALKSLRIARKEAKESMHWLRLLDVGDNMQEVERKELMAEALALIRILTSMIKKVED